MGRARLLVHGIPLTRMVPSALTRKKESRKRRLIFHVPAIVSLNPGFRLLQTDTSYIILSDIYDQHCEDTGITREDPIIVAGEKMKQIVRDFRKSTGRSVSYPALEASSILLTFNTQIEKSEFISLKKDIFDEIIVKLVPDDIITRVSSIIIQLVGLPSWFIRST